jgi:hypothetical protein
MSKTPISIIIDDPAPIIMVYRNRTTDFEILVE